MKFVMGLTQAQLAKKFGCRRQWRDKAVWPMAVESADKETWRLVCEIATMPKENE